MNSMRSSVWIQSVSFAAAASAAIFASHPVAAEPTEIMVRALAADAKFIGTSMGGMRVTIRDVRSGDTLASGTTDGPTGHTAAIKQAAGRSPRSEERRVGKECGSTGRAWWTPYP